MKAFFALVKNENIKTLKQTSYRVLLIIFALIIAVVPFISKAIHSLSYYEYTYDYEWYKTEAEMFEQNGQYDYAVQYQARYDANKRFDGICEELNVKPGDAVDTFYRNSYETLYVAKAEAEFMLSGKMPIEDIRANGGFFDYRSSYDKYVFDDGVGYDFDTGIKGAEEVWSEDIYYGDADEDYYFEEENIRRACEIFTEKLAQTEDEIRNFNLKDMYKLMYDGQAEITKEKEEEVARIEAELAKNPDDIELSYNLECNKKLLYNYQLKERAYKLQYENVYPYESWQRNTVEDLIDRAAGGIAGCAVMSYEMWKDSGYGQLYSTEERYNEYVKNLQEREKEYEEAVTIGFASLEKDIPLPGTIPEGSVKAQIRNQLGTIVSITSLIMIVLAGSILSAEYSSGTIRLLLIRPRKRSKILGSKYVSMCEIWFGAIILAIILSVVLDFVLFGVGDAFVPDLEMRADGTVGTVASVWGGLEVLFGNLLTSAVMITLALLLSTLVRRSALSIALPIIIQTVIGLVAQVCMTLVNAYDEAHFLVYTPLPYADLSVFRTTNAAEQMVGSGAMDIIDELFGMMPLDQFKPALGVIYLAGFTILFVVLSFVSFTKQQIKN